MKKRLDEGNTRYSVEVNYRTRTKEVLEGFAKIALGYVSAGLKKHGYHVRQIFDEEPSRIMVSSRNWDDGEWVGMISYSPKEEGGPAAGDLHRLADARAEGRQRPPC